LEYEDAVHKQAQAIVRKQFNDEEMKSLNQKIEWRIWRSPQDYPNREIEGIE
jgi:hypothetical protein